MVAAVIIGAVVYLSALERVRDFAVLKAMGVSNRSLIAGLALQAVLVALGAVAIAAIFQLVLAPAFPLEVTVPNRAFLQVPAFAVVMALVAGAVGMRRVARADPAAAFAGAGG
jgi:putative ABC transport system permease protein